MNFYSVGFYSHEECPKIILTNKEVFTNEQFTALCAKITAELYINRKTLFPEEYQYELSPEDREGLSEDYDPKSSFQDFYSEVAEYLVKNHGFEYVTMQATFSPFGWAKFIPKDDWEQENKDGKHNELTAIRDLL